jgi:hypothetical protein
MTIARDIYERNITKRKLIDRRDGAMREAYQEPHLMIENRHCYIFEFEDGSRLRFIKNSDKSRFYCYDSSSEHIKATLNDFIKVMK